MILEIVLSDGIGKAAPLVLHCNQVVIRQDNGTPIGAFAHFGPDGAYAATVAAVCKKCGEPPDDFNRMLRVLGINTTVIVDRLQLAKPQQGARLVAGPRPHE